MSLLIVMLTAAALLSVVAFIYLPAPFIWIALVWVVAFITAAIQSNRTYPKVIFVNLACALVVAGGAEAYYMVGRAPEDQFRSENINVSGKDRGIVLRHDFLGYAPAPGSSWIKKRWFNDEIVFEAKYTFNEKGLRTSPPNRGGADIDCILFFGGSFTFGNGLNDDLTLPYQVGRKTDRRYRIYNFAYDVYGPHQMLAALEKSLVDDVVDCQPKHAIFQAITRHGPRVDGRTSWDRHGPRYELDDQGVAIYRGRFDDPPESFLDRRRFRHILRKSHLYEEIFFERITPGSLDLMAAIVDKSRRILEAKYPEIEFHVLLYGWRGDDKVHYLEDRLRQYGMNVYFLGAQSFGHRLYTPEFRIGPHDSHPSALANEIIANFVVEKIVGE